MVGLRESHEIAVVRVVVFDQDPLVLQPNDGDPIPVVLGEGGNPQTEGRPRSDLLPWRGCFTPIESVYRPLELDTSDKGDKVPSDRDSQGASYCSNVIPRQSCARKRCRRDSLRSRITCFPSLVQLQLHEVQETESCLVPDPSSMCHPITT